ncbi:hypothetical protein [uncultured Thiocystis sp.]|uniref:AMP-binding enzyme n=1 Tax=uncultured Thiocystis sp. TaxID=1202134 RepID=UPI0025D2B8C2|nr:hypothetical protein [uncultured Thiocystis sp.]
MKDWCRSRLGRHELPRRIELVDALPKNATGKTSSASCAARASTSAGCHHGWHLNVDDGHWRVRFGGHCVESWRASDWGGSGAQS